MRHSIRDQRSIDEEAAAWLQILNKGGPAEHQAFAAWARESPSHIRAFLLMTALDIELGGIDASKTQKTAFDAAQVVPLPQNMRPKPLAEKPRRLKRPILWAAALIAVTVVGVLAKLSLPQHYSTPVGEQRTFNLSDGSVIYLNTNSRIALDFSSTARDIRLVTGEALFKVARDTTRPFRVHTDDAIVQAIGTEFNVRREAQGTRVSVIEGQIKVAGQQVPLSAGQEAMIRGGTQVVEPAPADVARTLAWRQRRLIFRSDELADIAAEFNRYNRSPQIRIEDSSLSTRRFSGVFDADDPESLAQVLAGSHGLQVRRTEREIVIRSR